MNIDFNAIDPLWFALWAYSPALLILIVILIGMLLGAASTWYLFIYEGRKR